MNAPSTQIYIHVYVFLMSCGLLQVKNAPWYHD